MVSKNTKSTYSINSNMYEFIHLNTMDSRKGRKARNKPSRCWSLERISQPSMRISQTYQT